MSHHESAAKGPDGRMVDRMLFFSDAVFAIVLTLLVLELRPPEGHGHADTELWSALGEMFRHFAAFFISFTLVGGWWLVHMRVTRTLRAFDWPAAVCNLLLLLFIALTPFAAALFGQNIASLAALQIYWTLNAAVAFAMTLLFVVIARGGGRLIGGIGAREWWFRFIQSLAPALAFVFGAWAASRGFADLSRFCWVVIFPTMVIARLVRGKPPQQA
jgi:uncharacterized membrane protein